jgi:hypothetical protein
MMRQCDGTVPIAEWWQIDRLVREKAVALDCSLCEGCSDGANWAHT